MSKEFDYTKLKHVTSVDQTDREVPYNLRQSGPTKVEMLISTCLLYTSPSPRDGLLSRMPSSA